jgi:hypothetical protein
MTALIDLAAVSGLDYASWDSYVKDEWLLVE